MSGARIRQPVLEDAGEIARLDAELGYAADPAQMQARLIELGKLANHFVAVAEGDKRLLGWIHAEHRLSLETGAKAEIVGLVVDPRARRTGVGRLLVDAAEQWARSRGLGSIVVRSNAARVESHAFYPGLGYRRSKSQHVYAKTLEAPPREPVNHR